jgi:ABC-type long-subunit fatty acid transport system fused permease/ATPase subunit
MSDRVEALPFKVWCNFITVMIHTSNFKYNGEESQNQNILRAIREKLVHFEDELPKLKEAATLLELAL